MGIEELVGFLLGVASGSLLRCFGIRWNFQAEPDGAPATQQPQPSEQSPAVPEATGAEVALQQAAAAEPLPTTAAEERRSDLKSAILEILRSSGEGLTLSAIAERMKRHFASIIGPVRLLIEEGLVEKHDKIYKIRGPA